MKKYSVILGKESECIRLEQKYIDTSPLMITSTLIESFFPLINGTISLDDQVLQEAESKVESIFGQKVLFSSNGNNFHHPKHPPLLDEIMALRHTIINWIDAGKLPSFKEDNLSPKSHIFPDTPDGNAIGYLQSRITEAPLIPMFAGSGEKTPSRIHNSDNLLALAWAEIWHALEYNIKARSCPYCGLVFTPPPNNPRKATCLRPGCKIKYEIDRHGGIELYREWERNRKKVPSKRPPGRPKKQKEGE